VLHALTGLDMASVAGYSQGAWWVRHHLTASITRGDCASPACGRPQNVTGKGDTAECRPEL
jgi:hypothetical protein